MNEEHEKELSGKIVFDGANLDHADLSNSKLTADGSYGAYIDFTDANLLYADLSGSKLTADASYDNKISFEYANLNQADLSGSALTAPTITGLPPPPSPPTQP